MVFTLLLLLISIVLFLLNSRYHHAFLLSSAITFLTMFYHFAMRFIVGETVQIIFRKKEFHENSLGFRLYSFEESFYKKIKVKRWKKSVITAKPEAFDVSRLSPAELLHSMLQAELVHRIIMLLSFVPLLFIIPFGAPVVFIVTSIFGCMIDCKYVIIQRYNRPRVKRLIYAQARRQQS